MSKNSLAEVVTSPVVRGQLRRQVWTRLDDLARSHAVVINEHTKFEVINGVIVLDVRSNAQMRLQPLGSKHDLKKAATETGYGRDKLVAAIERSWGETNFSMHRTADHANVVLEKWSEE